MVATTLILCTVDRTLFWRRSTNMYIWILCHTICSDQFSLSVAVSCVLIFRFCILILSIGNAYDTYYTKIYIYIFLIKFVFFVSQVKGNKQGYFRLTKELENNWAFPIEKKQFQMIKSKVCDIKWLKIEFKKIEGFSTKLSAVTSLVAQRL